MKKHQHNWIWWVDPQTGDEFWTCTECHEVESPNYTTNMKTGTQLAIEIESRARIEAMTKTERQKAEQEARKLIPRLLKQLGINPN